ncbi:hypothetical protein BDW02DRAFT_144524 [Decorospora gaudefroyi]|uniref:Uncharacterized protein n=1 Tax=Decorospora gaudefroyi TaxID=184978 RepID=A0A6A5K084_9PLEO|nr:hypothetical protein BDW02DRAFT_144524 [Decorospora gaudefroyi]
MAANIPIRSRHTSPSNSRLSTNNSILGINASIPTPIGVNLEGVTTAAFLQPKVPLGQPTLESNSRANTPSPLKDNIISRANLRRIL